MAKSHVSARAVMKDGKPIFTDLPAYRAGLKAMKLGDGEVIVMRVEREADAVRYGAFKYWHGYVLEPLINYTGDQDWRMTLKAMFLPDDKTSLTELDADEMKAFIEQSEAWAREQCPEAYERFGREYVA